MAVTTPLKIGRDPRTSIPNWLTEPPASADEVEMIQLVANTEYTLAVPANTTIAVFGYSPGANVLVARGASAITLPTSGAFTNTTAFLNPPGFYDLAEGETLRFRGDDTWYVFVRWFTS